MLRYTFAARDDAGLPRASGEMCATRPEFTGSARPLINHDPPVDPHRSDRSRTSPVVTTSNRLVTLDEDDNRALEALARNAKFVRADTILVEEGSTVDYAWMFEAGLGFRYKMLPGGHRQILGYVVPGHLCDLGFLTVGRTDYSIALLTESRIAAVPLGRLRGTIAAFPKIGQALALAHHMDQMIAREWLLNIGQRKAHQRLAHFLCEMAARLAPLGAAKADGSIEFPISQPLLADTLGLTPVHVNRTLQRLRHDGLIELSHRRLRILDRQRLIAIANFEGHYLVLPGRPG